MDELARLRNKIASVDEQILDQFTKRMELIAEVAAHKNRTQGSVYAPMQEKTKIQSAKTRMPPQLEMYSEGLMHSLLRLSRERQYELMLEQDQTWELGKALQAAQKERESAVTVSVPAGPDVCRPVISEYYPKARLVKVGDSTQALNKMQTGLVDLALLPWTEELFTFLAKHTLFISACYNLNEGEPFVAIASKLMLAANADRVSLIIELSKGKQELGLAVGIFADLKLPIDYLSVIGNQLYLEFLAPPKNKRALRALYQLEQETPKMRLLGWYPAYSVAKR